MVIQGRIGYMVQMKFIGFLWFIQKEGDLITWQGYAISLLLH